MLNLEIVREFIYQYFSNVSESKNGYHFHCRCPLCGDSKKSESKKRFHLDYNAGNPIYNCFNCGESGSFLQIYSQLKGIEISDAKKELYNYNADNIIQVLSNKKRSKIVKEIEHENFNYILDDCISTKQEPNGYIEQKFKDLLLKFIKDRNIPINTKLFVSYKGKYQARIIIPIYDENNDIIYFQARRLFDDMPNKYDSPTLAKGNKILNKYKFDKYKYIIITEGLLDALSIGNNGTSVLGKEIKGEFINEVLPLSNKGIIVALDNDKDGIKSLKKFMKNNKYNKMVKYFLFPKKMNYKDINNYVSENNTNVNETYEFIVNNSYTYESAYTKLIL